MSAALSPSLTAYAPGDIGASLEYVMAANRAKAAAGLDRSFTDAEQRTMDRCALAGLSPERFVAIVVAAEARRV